MKGQKTKKRRTIGKGTPRRKVSKAAKRKVAKPTSPRSKGAAAERTGALRKIINRGVRREAVKSGNRVKRKVR